MFSTPWARISASIIACSKLRVNDDVNEEWISDEPRQAIDGLLRQRLDAPYIREDGKLRPASWDEAFGRHRPKPTASRREDRVSLATWLTVNP